MLGITPNDEIWKNVRHLLTAVWAVITPDIDRDPTDLVDPAQVNLPPGGGLHIGLDARSAQDRAAEVVVHSAVGIAGGCCRALGCGPIHNKIFSKTLKGKMGKEIKVESRRSESAWYDDKELFNFQQKNF